MDTFYPGKRSVVFAILFAFLSSKNGRNLGAKLFHYYFKQTIMFWLPLRLRCKLVYSILAAKVHTGRLLMSSATRPWGAQWDYITPVKRGHWIAHKGKQKSVAWAEQTANDAELIIYYIHGGGFRLGDSLMYMESFIHIIEHLKAKGIEARIFSIEYRRNPEVDYHQTKEDCMDAYRYLIHDLNINSNKIVFAGDSAGGNLVASCLQSIRDLNLPNYLPQPAGNVQISPWISIDGSESIVPGKIYQDCLTVDMLNSDHGTYFGKITSSGTEKRDILRNPTISPLYGSFVGLCPTLVTYGGTEVFQHDNEKLIQYLKRDQVQVDVIHRPEAPHIWLICWILSPTYAMWKTDCSRLADWCAERVKYKQ